LYAKNGTQFPFILISPQLKNNYSSWPMWYILEVINWAKSTLRVDEKRIHVTGLSMGGAGVWTAIQEHPRLFATASPLCGAFNTTSKACGIAAENLPVWAFHGDADTTVPLSRSVSMVNAINACKPAPSPLAKMTVYPGVKHDAWNRAYRTDHTYHNPNLYEWMMSYSNTKNGGNIIPSANAGADKSYTSASTISLGGSGSDSDGSISSYSWAKISGPSASIASPASASTSVAVSAAGTYMFRLKVTDNSGNTDSDYVKVVVGSTGSSSSTNAAPVANAGSNVTLTLPSSTAILNGSATDSDGTIASYTWTKVSGPSGNLSGANTSKLTAWSLVQGTYVFRLTVKDNGGATAYDDVTVQVNGSTTNSIPFVSAGADINLTLPASTAICNGTATDSNGTIVSYTWTKVSGPAANLSNATTSKLTAWALVAGTYIFRLTVKDNSGATAYDDVKVVVKAAAL
jgi:dienelactone hydrolase